MNQFPFLQVLTWDDSIYTHLEQVHFLLQVGARWIQLRQKKGTFDEKIRTACTAATLCHEVGAVLIIDDSPEICLKSGADGVHLGLSDMSIAEARQRLGKASIIGGTANTSQEVADRMDAEADYIGIGPFRFTGTKKNLSPILGSKGVKQILQMRKIRQQTNLYVCPITVIGGIQPADGVVIRRLGAESISVCSAIVGATDISAAYRIFL